MIHSQQCFQIFDSAGRGWRREWCAGGRGQWLGGSWRKRERDEWVMGGGGRWMGGGMGIDGGRERGKEDDV
jgi:hypothetical protein